MKDIKDKAAALRQYAKQTGESLESRNMLAEIELRAARRAGELLIEMKENGERHDGKGNNVLESNDLTPKLTDIGITVENLRPIGLIPDTAYTWGTPLSVSAPPST